MNETDQSVVALVKAATAAHSPVIVTSEDYVRAAKRVLALRQAADYIASREAEILNPVLALKKTAKGWFGTAKAQLAQLEDEAKAELIAYVEHRVGESAAASKAAIERGDTLEALELMVAVPAVTGIEIRNQTSFEVIDENAVPDEYWLSPQLDAVKIRKALRAGLDVPGVVSKTEVSLAISVKAANEANHD